MFISSKIIKTETLYPPGPEFYGDHRNSKFEMFLLILHSVPVFPLALVRMRFSECDVTGRGERTSARDVSFHRIWKNRDQILRNVQKFYFRAPVCDISLRFTRLMWTFSSNVDLNLNKTRAKPVPKDRQPLPKSFLAGGCPCILDCGFETQNVSKKSRHAAARSASAIPWTRKLVLWEHSCHNCAGCNGLCAL